MLVSFTELATNSETLQALSGMWEFFLGGGGEGYKFQNYTLFRIMISLR